MRGCISTSKRFGALAGLFLILAALSATRGPDARADDSQPGDRTLQPEEEDFTGTPYTEYGEFNEENDEAAEAKFFQYGRFFGVSIGLGFENATGNRGLLWQGGFPMIDFKLHYWFDFNFALDLNLYSASHFYEITTSNTHIDVNMVHLGVDLKYYFDTKNLSAPISFANPYILLGLGSYTKTETSPTDSSANVQPDSSFGLSLGGGLEFALKPRKVYFELESKLHIARFKDTYSTDFQSSSPSIPNLTGAFYTVSGSILFTW